MAHGAGDGRVVQSLHLRESGFYDDVEVVVPCRYIPFGAAGGGYNPVRSTSPGIASQLGVEVDRRSVRRKRNTESQALKARRDRARNVEDAFAVGRPGRLAGRHVLLVDDVFTTGNTLLATTPPRFCARRPVAASASPRSPSRGTLWA